MTTTTTTHPPIVEILLLYDGVRTYSVARVFYDAIRREILDVMPALFPDAGYTVEMLCGSDIWLPMSDTQQRLAGRCVAHMVRNDELPLRRLGCRHKSPARYALG